MAWNDFVKYTDGMNSARLFSGRAGWRHLAALLAVCLAGPGLAAGEERYADVPRIVAVADIHGAYTAFVELLGRTGLVSDDLVWTGGKSHLVVVGDIVDRGPGSRAALDLLMRLESEAHASGGRVHVLLGNHELMVLTADLRYVTSEEFKAFAPDETPAMRDAAFRSLAMHDQTDRASFDTAYPPGYFALRSAFSPSGQYGRWLLEKPLALVLNDTAFVHGGLPAGDTRLTLDYINGNLHRQIKDYAVHLHALERAGIILPTDDSSGHLDRLEAYRQQLERTGGAWPGNTEIDAMRLADLYDATIFGADGPLWYRGSVACGRAPESTMISRGLASLGARRAVIGHTPTPGGRVLSRFEGRLIRLDTGMTRYYGGYPAALVIEDDEMSVTYTDDGPSVPHVQLRSVGVRPAHLDDAALESFLLNAQITGTHGRRNQRTATLERDGVSITARMRRLATRTTTVPEVAAYRLDTLIGLDMVPVAVIRQINGRNTVLEYLPPGAVTESERLRTGGGPQRCPLERYTDAMQIWDLLIANTARSRTNIYYDARGAWQMLLTGHERAFQSTRLRTSKIPNLGTGWRTRLAALDTDTLEQSLDGLVDSAAIAALLSRRDAMIAAD
jgi:hypothetical protein